MGYYINKDSRGTSLDSNSKVKQLLDDGAEIVSGDEFVPNLICVIDNSIFQAAGYCFSEREYEAFKEPDGRRRTWLTHPKAAELAGYKN